MIRSALLLLSGNAFVSLVLLLRNLMVARMISVADYGIASTFAIALVVVEMASAMGLQQQIVQAKEGDDPHFQAALQGFQVLRGLGSTAVMLIIAGWMADFMGIPEVTWAYRLLSLVPLLNSFVHFDMYRLNRQMVFWPMLMTGAVPALISVVLLWPLVHLFGDWRVMLYTILGQSTLAALVSQVLARRPYRLVLDRGIMGRSLRFGWPLLANAVLLFFVFQGDRLIVGRVSGMVPLAIFSMGITLTLTPTLVMAKTAQSFFLPQLTRALSRPISVPGPGEPEGGGTAFDSMTRVTLQAALLNGALTVAAMAVLSAPIVHLLLSHKYNDLIPLLVPLAVLAGMRVCKSGPAVVALAKGRTGNAVLSNLPRVLALPIAWFLLQQGGDLMQIIWLGILAELVGYGLALSLMGGVPRAFLLGPFALYLAYLAVVLALSIAAAKAMIAGWACGAAAVVLFPLLLLVMPDLRRYAARRIHLT